MMRDRFLTAVLPLLTFFWVWMLPLPLQAQPDISVTIPEVKPTPGETVTLSVTANLDGAEVESYSNMEFTYDSTVLSFLSASDGSELSFGSNNLTVNDSKTDTVSVSNLADNPPVSGTGEFLQLKFELTDAIANPGTPLRLSPSSKGVNSTSLFDDNGSSDLFEITSIDQGSVGDLEIQNGRQDGTGSTATVTGTVSRALGAYVRFQDDTGPTDASGLTVGPVSGEFQTDISEGNITKGTRLYVRGALSDAEGLLRVNGPDLGKYTILKQGAQPAAQEVSLSTLQSNGEEYESELLRVDGLSFPGASGTFDANKTYTVEDETSSLDYRIEGNNQTNLIGESIPTGTFTYEGVLGKSSSGYQLVPIRPSTALPVDLTGFTAVRSGSSVVLRWQTANETNNAGFRVQHEQAGGWQEIGFVESKAAEGTTSDVQSYRFTVQRRVGPGTHRFRLEQLDLDGTTDVSEPVQVEIEMDGALHLSAPAPNPASDRAVFSFAVRERTEVKVVIYDVLGKRIRTVYEGRPSGEEGRRLTVETGDLASGVYVVRLQAGGRTRTERLTVVQ